MRTRFSIFSLVGLVAIIAVMPFGLQYFNNASIPVTGQETVSYSKDVRPILESRCMICHGIQYKRDQLDLRTYESLMIGSKHGPVIIPGAAQSSLLIQKIQKGDMPKRGPKLFPAQLNTLIKWINDGAPNN